MLSSIELLSCNLSEALLLEYDDIDDKGSIPALLW